MSLKLLTRPKDTLRISTLYYLTVIYFLIAWTIRSPAPRRRHTLAHLHISAKSTYLKLRRILIIRRTVETPINSTWQFNRKIGIDNWYEGGGEGWGLECVKVGQCVGGVAQTVKTTAIRRIAVRETIVSRHHGGPIKDTLETPSTLQH